MRSRSGPRRSGSGRSGTAAAEAERSGRLRLGATTLSQFVRLESCERFLWYRLHPRETEDLLRTWQIRSQPLGILLRNRGARHEVAQIRELEAAGFELVDLSESGPERVVEELRTAAPRALLQPKLQASLGDLDGGGIADVLLVHPDGEGLRVEIQDAKASRKDRPEHRIQIAFYGLLLREMLRETDLPISELAGSVWRIPAGPGEEQPAPFPLEPYEEAVRLLLDDRGVVARIARARRREAPYHLTYKCDGCEFNALCMREAAETESLTLVPFMSPRDRVALERAGVRDVRTLALLKELPRHGEQMLRPYGEPSTVLRRLETEWPLCANLDAHIQRARRVARALGHTDVDARGWIYGAGWGSLPDRKTYPDLVQVFVDGQHDYLQDALYLAGALVVSPSGRTEEVIELAPGPPDLEAEGNLVVRWTRKVLQAIRAVAGDEVLLHIYVYDRYDQKILLEALQRHLDRLSTLPDFFDLLTQGPGLEQQMFSFLSEEIRERENLGILCHSLPLVAGWGSPGPSMGSPTTNGSGSGSSTTAASSRADVGTRARRGSTPRSRSSTRTAPGACSPTPRRRRTSGSSSRTG